MRYCAPLTRTSKLFSILYLRIFTGALYLAIAINEIVKEFVILASVSDAGRLYIPPLAGSGPA